MNWLRIKQLLLIMPLMLLLAACNKQQDKAEQLVRDYLQQHNGGLEGYKSLSFSKAEKLKDIVLPGAKAPIRAYGRWQIEHTYSVTNGGGAAVTQTKVFQIDSTFTYASCCYVKMPGL